MGRLDDLITKTPEKVKTITVRLPEDVVEKLMAVSKRLEMQRGKLVSELINAGLEELEEKLSD